MTSFLIFLLVANVVLISLVGASVTRSRRQHKLRIAAYEAMIVSLLQQQTRQTGSLLIADELRDTLKASRDRLGDEILALQYQLIDTLAKNNLIE